MSRRNSDRIEIDLSWNELADNPTADWAINYLKREIKEYAPAELGLVIVKKEHKSIYQESTGNRRCGVTYKLRYKSSYPGRRMAHWPGIFNFVLRMRELEKSAASELNLVVKIDLQESRLPWAFTETMTDKTVNSLSMRPGASQYTIKLPEVIRTPKGNPLCVELFGDEVVWVAPTANEIMIVGEPRRAYKTWRYFQQLERGATLRAKDNPDQRMFYAMGDLVTILTRDTTKSEEWYIYSDDNHNCPRMHQRFILCGNADETSITYLGLDYEFVDLKPYLKGRDLAI